VRKYQLLNDASSNSRQLIHQYIVRINSARSRKAAVSEKYPPQRRIIKLFWISSMIFMPI
jgi:hypothetical protein